MPASVEAHSQEATVAVQRNTLHKATGPRYALSYRPEPIRAAQKHAIHSDEK